LVTYWDFAGFERAPLVQGFTTSATADTPAELTTALTARPTARNGDIDVLPDLPAWLLGFLVGCAVFIFVVATTLFMAQFWASWRWTRGLGWMARKRWGARYLAVEQEDYEMDDIREGDDCGRVVCRTGGGEVGGVMNRKGNGKGKTGSLRINTAGRYAGLGIAVPRHETMGRAEEPRWSLDADMLPHRSKNTGTARSAYFTAPLRSTPYFTSGNQAPITKPAPLAFEAGADIGACRMSYARLSADSPDIFDITPPLHETLQKSGREDGGVSETVIWEVINGGVRGAAGIMARRFHDCVDPIAGPENGLLLPLREQERETALEKGQSIE
jgi:hypothetical protein